MCVERGEGGGVEKEGRRGERDEMTEGQKKKGVKKKEEKKRVSFTATCFFIAQYKLCCSLVCVLIVHLGL